MENRLILLFALLIDLLAGEYPRLFHPVVWMGKIISGEMKLAPGKNHALQFIYGILIVFFTLAFFCVPVCFLLFYLKNQSPVLYVIVAALLLKPCFSLRELLKTAGKIKALLASDNIEKARQETGFIVSRYVHELDKPALISAVVEMTSESLTDSIVAPLFYWIIFGLPGAVAYRVINTFDAMIGYHGRYEYLGRFAARADDVLNYIPARISGLLLVAAAFTTGADGRQAWFIMRRDHGRTESPNAGWTMAAAAGALNAELEKIGFYRLGDNDAPLAVSSIAVTSRLVTVASLFWFGLCAGISGACYAFNA